MGVPTMCQGLGLVYCTGSHLNPLTTVKKAWFSPQFADDQQSSETSLR